MRAAVVRTLIVADARTLWRDPLLIWMTAVPIAMAGVIRMVLQMIERTFTVDLAPFHPMIMGGYLMSAPGMIGFVIGFLLLDERDTGTLRALRVTPVPMRSYLGYRVAGPLLAGSVATVIGYPLAGISPLALWPLLAIATVAGFAAPLLALILATAAPNKVAGFAAVKVLNGINLLPVVAFFVPVPAQYVAGVMPTYWPMRALWSATAGEQYLPALIVGAIAGAAAVMLAVRVFERRLAEA